MIVDCFTFFDEFDVLELRLRTLEVAVDRFVLCEAPFTFRGTPKPLYFAAQAERFAAWRDRLTIISYPGPASDDPWQNEWGQRDFLASALTACAPDDLVLIGDCDEIPDPRLVGRRPRPGGILGHRMQLFSGYLNRYIGLGEPGWVGTRATTMAALAAYGSLSGVRKEPVETIEIVEGGWHFTSVGGAGVMQRKMQTYSHTEYDIPYFRDRERLEVEYREGARLWLPVDERFPQPLRDEPERWRHLVMPQPERADPDNLVELQHAHGCFAYVPPTAATVGVVSAKPAAWREAGRERFAHRFVGAFEGAAALLALAELPAWVVVDGLGRQPADLLSTLCRAGPPAVVAHVENARSWEVFERVIGGAGPFPVGRALGRAECEREIAAAGYALTAADRLFTRKVTIPRDVSSGALVRFGSFAIPGVAREALYDFLSDAFVFAFVPASG